MGGGEGGAGKTGTKLCLGFGFVLFFYSDTIPWHSDVSDKINIFCFIGFFYTGLAHIILRVSKAR